MSRIRLACMNCDRNDFDGVESLPSNWSEVNEVQTYEESIREADPSDAKVSVFDWYTHLGVCPECQDAELRSAEAARQAG